MATWKDLKDFRWETAKQFTWDQASRLTEDELTKLSKSGISELDKRHPALASAMQTIFNAVLSEAAGFVTRKALVDFLMLLQDLIH